MRKVSSPHGLILLWIVAVLSLVACDLSGPSNGDDPTDLPDPDPGDEGPIDPVAVASITDGVNGFNTLDEASGIAAVEIAGSYYALVASRRDSGLEIVDITDPATPSPVASVTDADVGFEELDGAFSVETVVISDRTYAVVAGYDGFGVQIVDITDPANPTAAGIVDKIADNSLELAGAHDIAIAAIGASVYALVAAQIDNGVQIIDITNPNSPMAGVALRDNEGGFDVLGFARGITAVSIGSTVYALVAAGSSDDGVQIIDLSDPSNPADTADITDGMTAPELDEAHGITTVGIGSSTYALVVSSADNGLQVIDISDPGNPVGVSWINDNSGGPEARVLDGAAGVTTVERGSSVYALVAGGDDNGVEILDITDPTNVVEFTRIFDGVDGFEELDGANDIKTIVIDSVTYVLVASDDDDGVQIFRL